MLMCKVLVLQALYNLSDEQAEYMIKDRLSFMRFLVLGLDGAVLDATTIWLFREQLIKANATEKLFARFDKVLTEQGYLAMSGQPMDATLVPAPRQRNNDGEKAEIKVGKTAQEIWPDKPARARQKNVDANWTLKASKAAKPRIDGAMLPTPAVPVFRYKNYVSTDRRHGLIRKWAVTSASDNNGARLPDLLDKANTASDVWATRPSAQRRMRRCWRSKALSPASIARSRRGERCQSERRAPTAGSPRSGRLSSMSSLIRSSAWASSSEPRALLEHG